MTTIIKEKPVSKAANGSIEAATNSQSKNGHRQGKASADSEKKALLKATWRIEMLPVERIEANPYQPRLSFNAAEMAELVASVRVHGVQQPIIVRTLKTDQEALQALAKAESNGHSNGSSKNGSGSRYPAVKTANLVRYQLVAGERRLRACKEAGRKHIPAIIRDDLTDVQAAELALMENIQRSNLTVIEEAAGYKRLMLDFRMKEERIAKKVGKSVQTIKETIKLLNLPQPVQQLLAQKKLSASHGHELLALAAFERVCTLVAGRITRDSLTAISLETTPLPNVTELKAQGLLVELDFRTQFDWQSECSKCPHKAYVRSGYTSYCLMPDEWKKKQTTAVELKKQESSRVMEAARQDSNTTVETEKLPQGSFRDLTYATVPAGCSPQCSCRSEAVDPRDPAKKVPVCLDPQRFSELLKAEKQAQQEERQKHFIGLWQQAKEALLAEETNADGEASNEASAGNTPDKVSQIAALVTLPLLRGEHLRYSEPDMRRNLAQQVGHQTGVLLPWDELLDYEQAETQSLIALQAIAPDRLLLFTACLLLAQEAQEAVRFSGPTPQLDFVLGRPEASQRELNVEGEPDEGESPDVEPGSETAEPGEDESEGDEQSFPDEEEDDAGDFPEEIKA